MSAPAPTSTPYTVIRPLPPVAGLALTSMVAVIVGTIYLAATISRDPNLALPGALVALAAVLLVVSVVLLRGIRDFAWDTFWTVWRWALLGYAVIAGMIAYVFVYDDTPRGQLVTLLAGLVLFVLDVTVILAFGVARYQPAD